MKLICPECKNEVNLARYPKLAESQIVECNYCGITLQVTTIGKDGTVLADIVDEAK